MAFEFEYTSTLQDLLDGFDADRTTRTGMRWWARAGVASLGLMWLFGAVSVLFADKPPRPSWLPLVWLVLGVSITWRFIIQPRLLVAAIRRENAAPQSLTLVFDASGIGGKLVGEGEFHRPWRELLFFAPAEKGITFRFDYSLHWLPNRVFTDAAERDALIHYVKHALDQLPDSDPELD